MYKPSCAATERAMVVLRQRAALDWMGGRPSERVEIVYAPGKRLVYLRQGDDTWGLMHVPEDLWFVPASPLNRVGVDQMMGAFLVEKTLEEVFA